MGAYKTIEIEITDRIAVLKFSRPAQLNAMNRQMMDEIIEGIQWINENKVFELLFDGPYEQFIYYFGKQFD